LSLHGAQFISPTCMHAARARAGAALSVRVKGSDIEVAFEIELDVLEDAFIVSHSPQWTERWGQSVRSAPSQRGLRLGPRARRLSRDLNSLVPMSIRDIHRAYYRAGSDMVETNTFQATSIVLDEYGLGEKAYEISKAAATLRAKRRGIFHATETALRRRVHGTDDQVHHRNRRHHFRRVEASYYDVARGLWMAAPTCC